MKPWTGALNNYQESDWPGLRKTNQYKIQHQNLPKTPYKPHNQRPTFYTDPDFAACPEAAGAGSFPRADDTRGNSDREKKAQAEMSQPHSTWTRGADRVQQIDLGEGNNLSFLLLKGRFEKALSQLGWVDVEDRLLFPAES